MIFPKNWGIHKLNIQLTSKLTICGGETLKIGIFHKMMKRIFNNKYLQNYMWFYKDVNLNILATKQKTTVGQFTKNK